MHWRHGVASDTDLATVVDPGTGPGAMSAEWPALLAETHARLLDPAGVRPLARPSPVGAAVGAKLESHPSWVSLTDAAALHPGIARDAVVGLSSVIRDALATAGASTTDTRRTLADLDAARTALDAARKARDANPSDLPLQRAAVDAAKAVERSEGAAQGADAMGARVGGALDADAVGEVIATVARAASERANGVRALSASGMGSALGCGDASSVPDDVVELLTPEVAAMLRAVGALRLALRDGRTTRHLPGREGMLGPDMGGLDRVGDLTPLARASLAGLLGPGLASLERLKLIQGRASVTEKGGGKAHKGDVVIVLDQSGSMDGARGLWANALALAVVLEARAENRVTAVVTFNGNVRASVIVDGPAGMRHAMAAICTAPKGGTRLKPALTQAAVCLAGMRRGGDPADVLIVTDGEWTADALDGGGFDRARLRAVFVGGSAPEGATFASSWSLQSVEGADASAVAVEIARTVV
jgi:hypothetical protein